MTTTPLFQGFDGLLSLSRREGVDVRPTLLRVITDLYVQAKSHTAEEERQFVELASRLIDHVDDATRYAVRARLAGYQDAPRTVLQKLAAAPVQSGERMQLRPEKPASAAVPAAMEIPSEADLRLPSNLPVQPKDAAEIHERFFSAAGAERSLILHNLAQTALKAAPPIPTARAQRAIETLEMAAFAADAESFAIELGESLILPSRVATEIVEDSGGEALAVAARALDMPSPVFQRILLFLKPEIGNSVQTVFRLARLYDRLGERSALVMLAAWRGSALAATRVKYQPALHDDERHRARAGMAAPRPALQPGSGPLRTGTGGATR